MSIVEVPEPGCLVLILGGSGCRVATAKIKEVRSVSVRGIPSAARSCGAGLDLGDPTRLFEYVTCYFSRSERQLWRTFDYEDPTPSHDCRGHSSGRVPRLPPTIPSASMAVGGLHHRRIHRRPNLGRAVSISATESGLYELLTTHRRTASTTSSSSASRPNRGATPALLRKAPLVRTTCGRWVRTTIAAYGGGLASRRFRPCISSLGLRKIRRMSSSSHDRNQ